MVRVIAPCLSGEARGKFGDILIFKKRFSTNVVGRYFKPRNPKSTLQTTSRNRTAKAVAGWQALSDGNQTLWNIYATQFRKNGYNMYCGAFMNWMKDHAEDLPDAPFLPV